MCKFPKLFCLPRRHVGHTHFGTFEFANSILGFNLDNPRGIGQMETTYKYMHLDRTNLRLEMEHGAL